MSEIAEDTNKTAREPRIAAIDIARGLALVAMAVYHFAWDLEFFGYAVPGTTLQPEWKYFARAIASSFLMLVGISLVLGHQHGLNMRAFGIRLSKVALAAGLISLVTWVAMPGGFIFFGILHSIALGSVLALAFLKLPWMGNNSRCCRLIHLRTALFENGTAFCANLVLAGVGTNATGFQRLCANISLVRVDITGHGNSPFGAQYWLYSGSCSMETR